MQMESGKAKDLNFKKKERNTTSNECSKMKIIRYLKKIILQSVIADGERHEQKKKKKNKL